MRSKIFVSLMAVVFGFGLFSSTAMAGTVCRIVPAHWSNGYYYSAHQVCWNNRQQCRWVAGYYRRGYWHEGHYICRHRYY